MSMSDDDDDWAVANRWRHRLTHISKQQRFNQTFFEFKFHDKSPHLRIKYMFFLLINSIFFLITQTFIDELTCFSRALINKVNINIVEKPHYILV